MADPSGGGSSGGQADFGTRVDEAVAADPLTVEVSPDGLEAYITLKGDAQLFHDVEPKDILEKLKESHVTYGIKQDVVEDVVRLAREGKPVQNRLVAKGDLPVDGTDAEVKMEMDFDAVAGILDEETGKIDYRERQMIKSVGQGFTMATKKAATTGKDGRTVNGNVLKARKGQDKKLTAGKNVEVVEKEGVYHYNSLIDGRPVYLGQLIEVQPAVQINGDVDYSVGNIRAKGSVLISGRVASGFVVEAEGEVEVGDYVEAATIRAKGKVVLRGGVKGAGKGHIYSESDVIAKYIERAKVEAKGDVIVANDILDSQVLCGGMVKVVGGKGAIKGGHVGATKGILAKRIGSGKMSSVTTIIEAGMDYFVERGLTDIEEQLRKAQEKIDALEARYPREALAAKDASKFTGFHKRTFLKAAGAWHDLHDGIKALTQKRSELMGRKDMVINAMVDVVEEIEPRVEIRLGRAKFVTVDHMRQVKFYVDPDTHVIASRFRGTVVEGGEEKK
ncbi:MAG: DUF342 domain-containing protein [Nitrospirae bacterium]|nr:DUF342 domain-containing protein [Nitrospirota bacterium]